MQTCDDLLVLLIKDDRHRITIDVREVQQIYVLDFMENMILNIKQPDVMEVAAAFLSAKDEDFIAAILNASKVNSLREPAGIRACFYILYSV